MKIKKLVVNHFRNINNIEIELDAQTTILSGKNGLGKSNVANALKYILSNTISTDKYGVGENDIDTIVPIGSNNQSPDTSVTIEFEDGTTFTKKYVTSYDINTGKVKDHKNKYYINNAVCDKQTEFEDAMYNKLGFTPTLKINSKTPVKEINLHIDSLYALQKLDANQLRALLIALGCGVTNEEIFNLHPKFEILKQYESKYLGQFSKMRKDLKDKRRDLEKEIEALNTNISMLGKVEEPDEFEFKALNDKMQQLIGNKKEIEIKGNYDADLQVLKDTLSNLKTKRTIDINYELSKINTQINELQFNISNSEKEYQAKVDSKAKDLMLYNKQLEQSTSIVSKYTKDITTYNTFITNYTAKIEALQKSQYQGFVECPVCGEQFAPDKEAAEQFEANKKIDINNLINSINDLQQSIANCNKAIEMEKINISNIQNEIAKIKEISIDKPNCINEYNQLNALKNRRDNIEIEFDNTEIINIENQIANYQPNSYVDKMAINEIDLEISNIETGISNYYMQKSKYDTMCDFDEKLKITLSEYNKVEHLIALVSDFIQTMIASINKKAYDITGIEFVMLEENISNDGVKEVCYATINGIEFQSVNTAEKLKVGIKFIERIKSIVGANDLPIIADRLEAVDSVENIKSLTTEQLFGTRVGCEDKITILEA